MAIVHLTRGSHSPGVGKLLSLALAVARAALMLLGPVGLMALAIVVRYAVFEYFHGGEQTLRALWHVLRA